MKAMVVSPVGGRVPPNRGVLHNGLNLNGTRRDLEAEEVAAYLTKLKSLVPDMPRKRKLSKLEVIQRVIEYICDLQTTLEENVHQETIKTKITPITRQPLQPLLNKVSSVGSTGSTTPAAAATAVTSSATTMTTNNTVAER
ncbi:PREDICTED: DNA-binding protein inhibitor ID-1 [Polistes dominula]|uniref:DNA-binding protein inhibitor ID-1 n=1 Tax=Polistes dominula TaxID=743375 RepID=A0ABM1IYA8_POLDO|nr:PREDICTED: DNA-binding protein inhibitor ID-1 [Polistes dominula]